MVVIICGFYSKSLIFPFFAPKKTTSNTIKVGQVMIHQLNFFSKYSPTIRECANVQPNPKLLWVLGLFGIYVSATHVRTPKKPLPALKSGVRSWVINWKMLSSNAPILCEFCVQNPSQNNVFSGTFYLWPWIWWMRQVNLLNKLQSQKGSHKKVVRMDFLAFSEPSSQNQWENDWVDMNFKKIAIWTTL